MAEDKKSFILYTDKTQLVRKLVEADRKDGTNNAGELMLHIYEYVSDLNPTPINFIVDIAFDPIKQNLKRDLRIYKHKIEGKSNAGVVGNLKRWQPDLYKKYIEEKITLKDALKIAEDRKASQCDNSIAKIAVNDTVNVNDTDTLTEYSEKEFLEDWGKCRKSFKNLPTNILRLKTFEDINFKAAKKDYSREQFQHAMRGLFSQEVINFSSMTTTPGHFLENVERYYNAFISKDYKQYGSKQIQY